MSSSKNNTKKRSQEGSHQWPGTGRRSLPSNTSFSNALLVTLAELLVEKIFCGILPHLQNAGNRLQPMRDDLKGTVSQQIRLFTVPHSFPQKHMIPTDHRLYRLCEMILKGQFRSIFGLLTVYPSFPPRRMIPTNHRLYSLCEMMLKGESRSIFGFLTFTIRSHQGT
jgi:hypothetical protein